MGKLRREGVDAWRRGRKRQRPQDRALLTAKSTGQQAAYEAALAHAFRLLARRARTGAEMGAALERKKIPARITRRVLGRLRELGYIDDRKYARDLVETLGERGFGSARIRWELERNGLADFPEVEALIPAGAEEQGRARAIVEARFGIPASLDGRTRVRAARWLLGRGFAEDVIRTVVDLES